MVSPALVDLGFSFFEWELGLGLGFGVSLKNKERSKTMQQPQQMIPMMPSFPPTNITTEQIQKVPSLLTLLAFDDSSFYGIKRLCVSWASESPPCPSRFRFISRENNFIETVNVKMIGFEVSVNTWLKGKTHKMSKACLFESF